MSAPVGANALVWLVEKQLPPGPACTVDDDAPVLILTGGFDHLPATADDFAALTSTSLRRLEAGLAVAALHPRAPVIVSGGGDKGTSEAQVAAALAVRLGLPPERLMLEPRAKTTWGNAQEVGKLLHPPKRVQLVTSALHAPRAVLALRFHGVQACRHSADSLLVPFSGLGYFAPQSSSLVKTELAMHELVGMASYLFKATIGQPSEPR